jgi:hypothetical protein
MAEQKLKYPVLDRIDHDGETHRPGGEVEMPPEQAEPLIRLKVLGRAETPAAPGKPDKNADKPQKD